MKKMKRKLTSLIILLSCLYGFPSFAQYFFVLPLPYPIDYLEKLPPQEELDIKEEEEVEEAPATDFRPLTQSDFKSQDALGYVYGKTFSVPKGLEPAVNFWKSIYHAYSIYQYVLHDTEYMHVYRVVDIADIERKRVSYRYKRRLIHQRLNAHKAQIRAILKRVHEKRGRPDTMSVEEKKIFDIFKGINEQNKFLRARYGGRIRSQLGQQERFRQGIVWAGRYLSHMERIFKEHNLPIEITRLPFVESSFNLKARSKVGASGIWQFIRSTGKRFLQINRAVDQRNDPIESTIAAAKLLKLNYKSLQSWPLAITAYNHGRAGMMRAVKGVHTRELPAIIAKYKSRTFGFASKNFYASFLAALAVEIDYEKYFGSINIEAPIEYDEVEVEHYIGINTLTKYTNLSKRLVKRYNPALTSYVFREKKYIPRGYKLKLPSGMKGAALQAFSNIPRTLTKRNQRRSIHHRVRRGDTLSYLANRYDTTVRAIRSANQLGKFIYAGQVIVIPK